MFHFIKRKKIIQQEAPKMREYHRKINEPRINVDITQLNFLLVDDNEVFLRLTSDRLAHEHANLVHVAHTGEEAIRLYKESPIGYYHVILTDIIMPDIYGYILARNIRALERVDSQMVTILALSCKRADEKGILDGLDDFISKPLKVKELKEKLELYLRFPLNQEVLNESKDK